MENQVLYLSFFLTFLYIGMTFRKWKKSGDASKLPPGPRKLPFIGNLHLFITTPAHHCLRHLVKRYGSVMHLQLGQLPAFVLSSEETAKAVLKTHDLIFSSRPPLHSVKLLTYNFTDIGMAPYGDYWRQARKKCSTELLTHMRVQSFRSLTEEEMSNLIRDISSKARSVINIKKMVISSALSIISRAAFGGKSIHQEEFRKLIPDIIALFGGLSLADLFPSIKLLHFTNVTRPKSKKLHQKVDEILENIIMEHRARRAAGRTEQDDLVSVLLDLQDEGELEIPLTTANIKAIILDMFTAGSDTSSTVVEWAMSEMLRNPRIMEQAQAEVRHVFAGEGNVDEARLDELKYLKLVIKETLRLHTVVPLLAPRQSTERWRRICPGMSFGMAMIEIKIANLLYHFDWKLPGEEKPEDLDMTEVFSTVARRKHDLCLVPLPYLPTHMS
ncbi:hypothetical protein SLE2022_156370 [Rubroshorea leprosula]